MASKECCKHAINSLSESISLFYVSVERYWMKVKIKKCYRNQMPHDFKDLRTYSQNRKPTKKY